MILLGKIWKNLREKGETPAYCCEGERISYRQLGQWTGRLCAYLKKNFRQGEAILVYGHKQPMMAAALLACAFGGFPFVPVDQAAPFKRIKAILASARPQAVLAVEHLDCPGIAKLSLEKLEKICLEESDGSDTQLPYPKRSDDEIFYIIYTSGSTGSPKGVRVTCGNWILSEAG